MICVRMLRHQYMCVCQHACLCLLLCSIYPPLCLRLLSQDEDLKQVSLLVLQSCLKQRLPVSDGQFLTLLMHTLYIQYIHTSTVHMYLYVCTVYTYIHTVHTVHIRMYSMYIHIHCFMCDQLSTEVCTYVCMYASLSASPFLFLPSARKRKGGRKGTGLAARLACMPASSDTHNIICLLS